MSAMVLAEQTRPLAFLFCAFAVAAGLIVVLLGRAERRGDDGAGTGGLATARKALVPLLALSLVFGAISTVWVVRTGHAGAKSVWSEDDEKKGGDEGSEEGGERGEYRTTGGSDEQQQSTDGDADGD